VIEIYLRHRGPYVLLLTRQGTGTKHNASGLTTDRARGPFNAEEAHDEARMLVNDPRDSVIDVHVFSESEQQFIGAMYRRGTTYDSYVDLKTAYQRRNDERMESSDQLSKSTLVRERNVPLPEMDDLVDAVMPAEPVPEHSAVPDVQPEARRAPRAKREPTKKPGDRFPTVRGRALTLGDSTEWPKAESAQLVRSLLETRAPLTIAEIVQAIGPQLNALGVQVPKALVSRLKQAGLLKEIA